MTDIEMTENDILEYIANTRKGELHNELNVELKKAVAAVRRHNGTATLSLKISIKKDPGYQDVIAVTDDLVVKVPKPSRGSQIMFPTKENSLSFNQQEQGDFFNGELEESKDGKPSLEESGHKVTPIK